MANRKQSIEAVAINCAREMLHDNNPQQPQKVVDFIVTRAGFPLSYEIFAGSTFEREKMLPVLDKSTEGYQVKSTIIIAEVAMLSRKDIFRIRI